MAKADPRLRRMIRAAVREAAALSYDARSGAIEIPTLLARTLGLPEQFQFEAR